VLSVHQLDFEANILQRQVKEGIDAVIVDSVLAIRKGLTTAESASGEQTRAATTPESEKELKTLEEGQ